MYIWHDNLRLQHLSLSLVKPTHLMGHLRTQSIAGNNIQFNNQVAFRHGSQIASHRDSDSSPRSQSEALDTVWGFLHQEDNVLIEAERGKMTSLERSSVGSSGGPRSELAENSFHPEDDRQQMSSEYGPNCGEPLILAETEPSHLVLGDDEELKKEEMKPDSFLLLTGMERKKEERLAKPELDVKIENDGISVMRAMRNQRNRVRLRTESLQKLRCVASQVLILIAVIPESRSREKDFSESEKDEDLSFENDDEPGAGGSAYLRSRGQIGSNAGRSTDSVTESPDGATTHGEQLFDSSPETPLNAEKGNPDNQQNLNKMTG